MQLYPAMSLKDGKCVRPVQGHFQDLKVYSDAPWEMAGQFEHLGAAYLHLVDLDGAYMGRTVNETVIRQIAETVQIPIQIGGGIRSMEAVEMMLELGVTRVIIGTKAAKKPEFMGQLIEAFGPEYIVAGIDARDGMVTVEGREKRSEISAVNLCSLMKSYGVRHVIYTDIARDGMLLGPNIAEARLLTETTGLDIIVSGGISSLEDLMKLKEANITGAAIGRALCEERIDLAEAIRLMEEETTYEG